MLAQPAVAITPIVPICAHTAPSATNWSPCGSPKERPGLFRRSTLRMLKGGGCAMPPAVPGGWCRHRVKTGSDPYFVMVTSPFRWPGGRACGAVGSRRARHLAFDHLDLVDGAFDDPGAPGHGQAVAH